MAFLQYDFRVVGVQNVHHAIASIERRALRSMHRMGKEAGMTPGTMRATTARRSGASDALRGFDQIGRAARAAWLKQGRDEIAQARKVARERVKIAERSAREEARARVRAEKEAARQVRTIRASRTQAARNLTGTAGRSIAGSLRSVGTAAGGLLAIGGGFAVANAVNSEKQLRAQSAALANQAYGVGGDKRSREQIQASVEDQSAVAWDFKRAGPRQRDRRLACVHVDRRQSVRRPTSRADSH